MGISYNDLFSQTAKGAQRSAIRELLKLTRNPEIISFAGGLPAPGTFPLEDIAEMSKRTIEESGTIALQYGPTEGDQSIKEQIAQFMAQDGMDVDPAHILITAGSQQGLDIVGKVFLDPDDAIMLELPSYIGGLQAFQQYRPQFHGIPMDDDGIIIEVLEERLHEMATIGKKVKFIYVVPDFQNPSGVTLTAERRKRLLELAREYDTVIVEDSPYRALRFTGEAPDTLLSMDTEGRVIHMSTFSKILCPGFRLGWLVANPEIMDRFVMIKQALDLCAPTFTQLITAKYMADGKLDAQLEMVADHYKEKCDVMLAALDEHMPQGVEWTRPQGGLFLWVRLPQHLDTTELFKTAIEHKVAYVTGTDFFCDHGGKNTLRLNFSFPTVEQIGEGIKRLAGVFAAAMR